MVSPSRGYKERRKRSSYEEVMNFRSLLIILYLNLNQNSEALSEGVTDLIRGTPCVLEYAPRTPRDVDTRTRALRIRKQ